MRNLFIKISKKYNIDIIFENILVQLLFNTIVVLNH